VLCALAVAITLLVPPGMARAGSASVAISLGSYAQRTVSAPDHVARYYSNFESRQSLGLSVEAQFGGLIHDYSGPRLGLRFRHSSAKTYATPVEELGLDLWDGRETYLNELLLTVQIPVFRRGRALIAAEMAGGVFFSDYDDAHHAWCDAPFCGLTLEAGVMAQPSLLALFELRGSLALQARLGYSVLGISESAVYPFGNDALLEFGLYFEMPQSGGAGS